MKTVAFVVEVRFDVPDNCTLEAATAHADTLKQKLEALSEHGIFRVRFYFPKGTDRVRRNMHLPHFIDT